MKNLILCLTLFLVSKIQAYPIDPRPLRMLVQESECVIVGYVQKIIKEKTKDDDWGDTKALIEIKEVLQGNIKKKIIEVYFTPNMICPEPPIYVENTTIIAFLDKRKDTYSTHALNYGLKTLKTNEDLDIYKNRIIEIQKILKIDDEKVKFEQTVEWLVMCAENPITRWEGTYELSPQSDFMSFYKQSKWEKFGLDLNKKQKERLKSALFDRNKENIEYVDFGLVDLIYNDYTEEIDRLLIDNLKNINEKKFWNIDNYMYRLSHRTNNPRANKIGKEFNDLYFEEYGVLKPEIKEKLKNLITEFLSIIE